MAETTKTDRAVETKHRIVIVSQTAADRLTGTVGRPAYHPDMAAKASSGPRWSRRSVTHGPPGWCQRRGVRIAARPRLVAASRIMLARVAAARAESALVLSLWPVR